MKSYTLLTQYNCIQVHIIVISHCNLYVEIIRVFLIYVCSIVLYTHRSHHTTT
jgi:hypothetical protein